MTTTGADVTLIEDARWIVAWDEEKQSHSYLQHTDLAFSEGRILHVGDGYDGPDVAIRDTH